jgi:hypothetical protein
VFPSRSLGWFRSSYTVSNLWGSLDTAIEPPNRLMRKWDVTAAIVYIIVILYTVPTTRLGTGTPCVSVRHPTSKPHAYLGASRMIAERGMGREDGFFGNFMECGCTEFRGQALDLSYKADVLRIT